MKQLRIQTEARGFTGIFGRDIDRLFHEGRRQLNITERLFWPPHVTLIKNAEVKSLKKPAMARRRWPEAAVMREVTPVGIGGYPDRGIYYLVVLCPAAQKHRISLGLPPKDLHITLSPTDNQDLAKGFDTLLQPLDWQSVSQKTLQIYVRHLSAVDSPETLEQAQLLCRRAPTWPPAWTTLADVLLCSHQRQSESRRSRQQRTPSQPMLSAAALAYARACSKTTHPKTLSELRKCLRKLSLQVEDVQQLLLPRLDLVAGLQPDIRAQLCQPWSGV